MDTLVQALGHAETGVLAEGALGGRSTSTRVTHAQAGSGTFSVCTMAGPG